MFLEDLSLIVGYPLHYEKAYTEISSERCRALVGYPLHYEKAYTRARFLKPNVCVGYPLHYEKAYTKAMTMSATEMLDIHFIMRRLTPFLLRFSL